MRELGLNHKGLLAVWVHRRTQGCRDYGLGIRVQGLFQRQIQDCRDYDLGIRVQGLGFQRQIRRLERKKSSSRVAIRQVPFVKAHVDLLYTHYSRTLLEMRFSSLTLRKRPSVYKLYSPQPQALQAPVYNLTSCLAALYNSAECASPKTLGISGLWFGVRA